MRFDPQSGYVPIDGAPEAAAPRRRGPGFVLIGAGLLLAAAGATGFHLLRGADASAPIVTAPPPRPPVLPRREIRAARAIAPEPVARDPVELAYQTGRACAATGRVVEAIPYFESVVLAAPHHAQARYQLGLALVRCGRKPEARGHLASLREDDPSLANLLAALVGESRRPGGSPP